MADSLGRKLEGLLPGPVLVVFGLYIAPFASSRLISSADQIEGRNVGAAVGLVLSLALRPVLIGKSDLVKQIAVVVALIFTLAPLGYCYYIWTLLAPALQPAEVQALQSKQFLFFVIAMGFLCLTISLASLAYPTNYRKFIVFAVAVVAIVILGFVAYDFWRSYH